MMGEYIRQIWVKNAIVRICSLFGTIGKMMRGSGLVEIVIMFGIFASGSLDHVELLKGKHYNSPADLWYILSGPGNRVQTFFLD